MVKGPVNYFLKWREWRMSRRPKIYMYLYIYIYQYYKVMWIKCAHTFIVFRSSTPELNSYFLSVWIPIITTKIKSSRSLLLTLPMIFMQSSDFKDDTDHSSNVSDHLLSNFHQFSCLARDSHPCCWAFGSYTSVIHSTHAVQLSYLLPVFPFLSEPHIMNWAVRFMGSLTTPLLDLIGFICLFRPG